MPDAPSTLRLQINFQGNDATNSTGILAAGSVLAILLFVVLQRSIVGAFVAGALKR
jgi:hypothetical protein